MRWSAGGFSSPSVSSYLMVASLPRAYTDLTLIGVPGNERLAKPLFSIAGILLRLASPRRLRLDLEARGGQSSVSVSALPSAKKVLAWSQQIEIPHLRSKLIPAAASECSYRLLAFIKIMKAGHRDAEVH